MSERDQPKPEDLEVLKDLPVEPDLATIQPAQSAGADVPMNPELQAFIGRQLVATFDEVVNEPVPDRLLELLRQLDAGSSPEGASPAGDPPADKVVKQ